MSKRPGNKKTVGAWVTPEMQSAIDEWRRRHPNISQSAFAQMAYAELLRKDGIKIEDAAVFRDGRVRDPNSNERPAADQLLGLAGDIANPLPSTGEPITPKSKPPRRISPRTRKRKPSKDAGQ